MKYGMSVHFRVAFTEINLTASFQNMPLFIVIGPVGSGKVSDTALYTSLVCMYIAFLPSFLPSFLPTFLPSFLPSPHSFSVCWVSWNHKGDKSRSTVECPMRHSSHGSCLTHSETTYL